MSIYFARPENVPNDLTSKLVLYLRQHFHNEVHALPPDRNKRSFDCPANEAKLIERSSYFPTFIFLAFPDGKIHYRHMLKIEKAFLLRKCVYEVHLDGTVSIIYRYRDLHERALCQYKTADRIWHNHRYTLPFLTEVTTAQ